MSRMSIQSHMIATYGNLRIGIALLAISFPVILALVGYAQHGLHLQESISAYYHAFAPALGRPAMNTVSGNGVMRNWFVGILWAIGVFLILYRGFGYRENWALNFGGFMLIMVAMNPMEWGCGDDCAKVSIHGISAILFFLAIGYVCIFRATDTILAIKDQSGRDNLKRLYRIIGATMWSFPLFVAFLEFFGFKPFGAYTVFFIEAAGIWTFAAYWLLKSRELKCSNADESVFKGKFSRPNKKVGLQYWLDTTPYLFSEI